MHLLPTFDPNVSWPLKCYEVGMKTALTTANRKLRTTGNLQDFGSILRRPIALQDSVCLQSVKALNQVLADTITLRDLYKKHHWQTGGPHFYSLHLLFDKHYSEQADLVDELAERIQQLGGVSLAMAADVAEVTKVERPPRDREEPVAQIRRLLKAHEQVLTGVRAAAKKSDDAGDDGTNDLLVSGVIRTNEQQVWFVAAHLDTPNGSEE